MSTQPEMKTVAFIGLGVMGYPMAGHLQSAGFEVRVFNRTGEKSRRWHAQFGGTVCDTPLEAARTASVVCCCVGNDDDVRSVVLGEQGALAGMEPGAILVDHTTASAQLARELHQRATEAGCGFLDAPVSGGQQGAERGALSVMVGGEAEHFQRAKPVLEVYGKAVSLIGPPGSGQLCKMVNQICIAGLLQGLSEGLHFARQAQLDVPRVLEVISKGAAQSWQMENRSETMLRGEYEHGFAVDWMRKDLQIALNEALRNGSTLPVTALVDQFYAEVQTLGGGRWDTSSLLARLQHAHSEKR
ncbi:NAD(P)-dependent oxidoreductase [Gilvimarinus sp. F26214L]|uniref:NAD(P)-dependent oxidoreductase n=1 Tax=Gilvimarinus sp. DZF01 TaxID=3461371 RepID=UPI00404622B8